MTATLDFPRSTGMTDGAPPSGHCKVPEPLEGGTAAREEDPAIAEKTVQMAERLLRQALASMRTSERRQARRRAGLITDPAAKALSMTMTDRTIRSTDAGRTSHGWRSVLSRFGLPRGFSVPDRLLLWISAAASRVLPDLVLCLPGNMLCLQRIHRRNLPLPPCLDVLQRPGLLPVLQLEANELHLLRPDSFFEFRQKFLYGRPAVHHFGPVRNTKQQVKVIAHRAVREHLNAKQFRVGLNDFREKIPSRFIEKEFPSGDARDDMEDSSFGVWKGKRAGFGHGGQWG